MQAALRRLRIALLPVPGQAVGLAVLVAVLAAAVVSAPLMVASAEQAAWEQQERRLPASALGTTVLSSTFSGDGRSPTDRIARIDDLDDAVRAAAAESGLSEPALFLRLRVPGEKARRTVPRRPRSSISPEPPSTCESWPASRRRRACSCRRSSRRRRASGPAARSR